MEHTVSLKLNHVFRRLYGRGKSAVNPCLAVYCRKNNLGYSRLGLTVGVKLGKAVVRNRTAAESKRPTASMRGLFPRLRHRGGGPGAGCPQPLPGVGALAPVSGGQARPAPEGGGLIEAPASGLDPGLPHVHLSLPSPLLPVYPHLLGLCPGGGGEIRGVEGGLSRSAPYPQMSALPQAGFH